ncbi:hypothetical protein JT358_07755 [Micrococcales bacterium 31B]|nr:hypothetical protein [Micrococcales bacterium 31B]
MTSKSRSTLVHRSVIAAIVAALVFLCVKPISANVIAYSAIGLLAVMATVEFVRRGITTSYLLVRLAAVWLTFVCFGTVMGLVHGNGYIPINLAIMLVVPAVFFVMSHAVSAEILQIVLWIASLTCVTLGSFVIFAVFAEKGGFYLDLSLLGRTLGLNIHVDSTNVTALTYYSLGALVAWAPLLAASLLFVRREVFFPPLWLRALATVINMAVILGSWRRGLILTVGLLPLVMAAVAVIIWVRGRNVATALESARDRKRGDRWWVRPLGVIVGVLALGSVLTLAIQPHVTYLVRPPATSTAPPSPVDETSPTPGAPQPIATPTPPVSEILADKDDSLAIRSSEIHDLTVPDSLTSAVFGHGFGAEVPRAVERDTVREPWRTELAYNKIFYDTGIIGVGLVITTFVLACGLMRNLVRAVPTYGPAAFVTSVASCSMLIGNATNPYIQAPGLYWPLLLPVALYCMALRSHAAAFPRPKLRRILGISCTIHADTSRIAPPNRVSPSASHPSQ